ncbi:MAG TPA: transposase, partial [Acidimicrobiales bacterium]|nr:transposase [Acidimicrobiales bacterium]
MGMFASQSPGSEDDLLLIDSTPVECARSRETVKRAGSSSLVGAIADVADYGYCPSHSRFFWGMRLHAIFAPDGTPRALELCSPKRDEREVGLVLLDRVRRHGPVTLIGDKGYAGRAFATVVAARDATIIRPRRRDEPGHSSSANHRAYACQSSSRPSSPSIVNASCSEARRLDESAPSPIWLRTARIYIPIPPRTTSRPHASTAPQLDKRRQMDASVTRVRTDTPWNLQKGARCRPA